MLEWSKRSRKSLTPRLISIHSLVQRCLTILCKYISQDVVTYSKIFGNIYYFTRYLTLQIYQDILDIVRYIRIYFKGRTSQMKV